MAEPDSEQVDSLFDRLSDLSAEERARVLADPALAPELREKVRRLLRFHDEPPEALRDPVLSAAALDAVATPDRIGPYRVEGYVGAGAMGVVYRARQESPGRTVAVKVLRTAVHDRQQSWRFEREARLLGRLQHPGIAQIIESGTARVGGAEVLFMAMEFIQGRTILEHARARSLSIPERAELVVDLAQAVHHAHQRGVIHRDLKPSNVLVTDEGQVKVIDFGIARALDGLGDGPGEDGQTLTGQVIGTLAYMSPEQVRGEVDAVDARSDVYALGVIAYQLFSGELPHDVDGLSVTIAAWTICERTPPRLGERVAACAGDLESIVGKALAAEPERRYASAHELAADLLRWRRNEPVEARPASACYRLGRLARRHRGAFAGAAAALLAILVGAGIAVRYAFLNATLATRAQEQAHEAERLRRVAEERADEIVRRTDPGVLAETIALAGDLWPAVPATVPAIDAWLRERAEPLAGRLPAHRAHLAELRERAMPYGDAERARDRERHPSHRELAAVRAEQASAEQELAGLAFGERELRLHEEHAEELERRVAELEAQLDERWTWSFADPQVQAEHDNLARLVASLEAFVDPRSGTLASVRARRERALSLEARTVTDLAPAAEWAAARASIAASPRYGGLDLEPIPGLRPLGEDADSGLWEFWHVESGARPEPRADDRPGAWEVTEETGIVLVLIPGGTVVLGAQADDPSGPNHDPAAAPSESPLREVDLPAFLLSKYECTQAQWARLGGDASSLYGPSFTWYGAPAGDEVLQANTAWNPVEQFSYDQAVDVLRRGALRLPTLDEWECGARGGTATPWWTGADVASLAAVLPGNLADARSRLHGAPGHWRFEAWEDPWCVHAPVGEFAPNPFGLHDTIGNVLELCAWERIANVPDGVVVVVGGSYDEGASQARVTHRGFQRMSDPSGKIGVRPAMSLVNGPP